MRPLGKLLYSYKEKIFRGRIGRDNVEEIWAAVTEKITGSCIGSPYKQANNYLFISCSSSEELSRVKMFESPLLFEIQKNFPNIQKLVITASKPHERT